MKKQKDNRIVTLARSRLSSIESKISKALMGINEVISVMKLLIAV